jgi:hypothetical protein
VDLHDQKGFRGMPQLRDEDGKEPAVCSLKGGSRRWCGNNTVVLRWVEVGGGSSYDCYMVWAFCWTCR